MNGPRLKLGFTADVFEIDLKSEDILTTEDKPGILTFGQDMAKKLFRVGERERDTYELVADFYFREKW